MNREVYSVKMVWTVDHLIRGSTENDYLQKKLGISCEERENWKSAASAVMFWCEAN